MPQASRGYLLARDNLPELFPTHGIPSQFWEQLGRTVATFGFLEEMLKKAIFALTATRLYDEIEAELAYESWTKNLENTLADSLWRLVHTYEQAAKDHQECSVENVAKLVEDMKNASLVRNVLCHGSWGKYDVDNKSLPLFYSKNNGIFETPVDITYMAQVQSHVAELALSVVDSVTEIGIQFPGSSGPGVQIV